MWLAGCCTWKCGPCINTDALQQLCCVQFGLFALICATFDRMTLDFRFCRGSDLIRPLHGPIQCVMLSSKPCASSDKSRSMGL